MFNKDIYLKIGEYARKYDHSKVLNKIRDYFNFIYDKNEMDNIGLRLQIVNKGIYGSKPMYLHGYVLSSALNNYIINRNISEINILETGTARGFSAIIMAKILEKHNIIGKINTIDYISHEDRVFSNCLLAAEFKRKVSRNECIKEWEDLANKYINFISGDSNKILNKLTFERIHFAFLDGSHEYNSIVKELNYVSSKQLRGDIIICDDYTREQFPQICKAIDEFLSKRTYNYKIFYGNDGTKKRGYVYMIKI